MFTKCRPGLPIAPRFVRVDRDDDLTCACGDTFPRARLTRLGLNHCLSCNPVKPHEANLPMHKQAYGFTNNPDLLRENCYGTHK